MDDLKFIDAKNLSSECLRQIAEIDNSIPVEWDEGWSPDETEHVKRFEEFQKLSRTDFFMVVFQGDQVVGFHGIRRKTESKIEYGHIATLWVRPSERKKGIAKTLKEMGVKWARLHGLKFIQTASHVGNKRIIEINLKNGFEPYSMILRKKI